MGFHNRYDNVVAQNASMCWEDCVHDAHRWVGWRTLDNELYKRTHESNVQLSISNVLDKSFMRNASSGRGESRSSNHVCIKSKLKPPSRICPTPPDSTPPLDKKKKTSLELSYALAVRLASFILFSIYTYSIHSGTLRFQPFAHLLIDSRSHLSPFQSACKCSTVLYRYTYSVMGTHIDGKRNKE